MFTPEQPKMTVKEARKRLGKKYRQLTDEQVARMVDLLYKISIDTLRSTDSKIRFE